MKYRSLVPALLLALAPALPLQAQSAGTIELGAFVRNHWFGTSYALETKAGPGVRLGFFPIRTVELEVDGIYIPTFYDSASVTLHPDRVGLRQKVFGGHGRLLFSLPIGEHSAVMLGGGVTYHNYKDHGHEWGPGGLFGVRLGMGSMVSIRVDGTFDYMSSPAPDVTPVDKDYHYGLQVGLSLLTGRHAAESFRGARDSDGDGVPDDADRCPDTPRGVRVDSSGCPRVQADTMQQAQMRADSIRADSIRMAQARADSIRADSMRVAQARADSIRADSMRVVAFRDSLAKATAADSARVAALRDSLRMTRNAARRRAINDSLAAAYMRDSLRVLITTRNSRLVLQGVNFATGTASLTQSSQFILDEVARSLVANPEVKVEIGGHTDTRGSRALNERLSNDRAEAVANYLAEHGVDRSRMTTKGYAWDKPVATNKTAAGRAKNRRTEIVRTD